MKILASILFVILFAVPGFSQQWLVSNGILMGALHVPILTDLYTVMFVDGTCGRVYNNCDPQAFNFHDRDSALAASQVLTSQILQDGADGQFHTHPAMINGCEGAEADHNIHPKDIETQCVVAMPYELSTAGKYHVSYAVDDGIANFTVATAEEPIALDLTTTGNLVFAVWMLEPPQPQQAPLAKKASGTADFNGDGVSDVLLRDSGGTVSMWLMGAAGIQSDLPIWNISMNWKIIGTGDFDGDGKSDILWRSDAGDVAIVLMNGTAVKDGKSLGNMLLVWSVMGIRDYDGDGKADILWQDNLGTVALWKMDGVNIVSSKVIGGSPDRRVQR